MPKFTKEQVIHLLQTIRFNDNFYLNLNGFHYLFDKMNGFIGINIEGYKNNGYYRKTLTWLTITDNYSRNQKEIKEFIRKNWDKYNLGGTDDIKK